MSDLQLNISSKLLEGEVVPEEHYGSIDGLRVLSCIGIIVMHIKANTDYKLSGFLLGGVIDSFTWFVYLFLMISGFGMCTGYLLRFQNNQINLESFYKKRYKKILPFFVFLCLIAMIMEPSLDNFYEVSMEITLLHGLLPNNTLNVLGVSWTLGVIFLFYLLFPAFSILVKTKKRVWLAFLISLWLNYICKNYFFSEVYVTKLFTPRHSFLYCVPLFIGGAIVYVYRKQIREIYGKCFGLVRWGMLMLCVVTTSLYFFVPLYVPNMEFYILLIIFMLWLSYAVGVDSRLLNNKVMRYLSSISMELYLAQMVIFRLIEKCGLLYFLGTGWVGFIMTCVLTVGGLIIFIECYKIGIKVIRHQVVKNKQEQNI